jgi:hypothetical protein
LDELDELDIKKEFPNILLIPLIDEIDVLKELVKIGVALNEGSIPNLIKAIYLLDDASTATAMSPASLNSILCNKVEDRPKFIPSPSYSISNVLLSILRT